MLGKKRINDMICRVCIVYTIRKRLCLQPTKSFLDGLAFGRLHEAVGPGKSSNLAPGVSAL